MQASIFIEEAPLYILYLGELEWYIIVKHLEESESLGKGS